MDLIHEKLELGDDKNWKPLRGAYPTVGESTFWSWVKAAREERARVPAPLMAARRRDRKRAAASKLLLQDAAVLRKHAFDPTGQLVDPKLLMQSHRIIADHSASLEAAAAALPDQLEVFFQKVTEYVLEEDTRVVELFMWILQSAGMDAGLVRQAELIPRPRLQLAHDG